MTVLGHRVGRGGVCADETEWRCESTQQPEVKRTRDAAGCFCIQDRHSGIADTRLERLMSVTHLPPWYPKRSVCRTSF